MNTKTKLYSETEFEKPLEERNYYKDEFKRYKKDKNLSEDEARMMAHIKCDSYFFHRAYLNYITGEDFGPYFKCDTEVSWLTNDEIAEMMGMTVSEIKRIKKKLKDLSYIKVQGMKISEIK